ncbi:hypothetical protein GCM10023094_28860 [Rhodococcus olei]|uniref:Antitoxin VbhA domain-containing protein n=1 Tax=Rhodococcus olei TaxID=2161675 RepID=A0ABP8P6A5_9NOCA
MTDIHATPWRNTRELTDTEIEVEVAGIKAGLEAGGLTFTAEAEKIARAVLAGEKTADEAISRGITEVLHRHGLVLNRPSSRRQRGTRRTTR